jgi:hypothetical protein
LAPNLTGVLEIAHQLLLLGINTESGLSGGLMFISLFTNVLKLAISVRVLLACPLFRIGSQAIVVLFEQSANHRLTYSVTLLTKPIFNINQTTVEPLSVAHRIACSVRRHDVQQDLL